MEKNCGCKEKVCGCADNVLTTKSLCPTEYPSCFNPEKCSETFSSDCVIYTGDTIVNLDIQKGAKLSDVLQKLVGAIVNPGCNFPTSPCLAVVGFYSNAIAQTTASFSWGSVVPAIGYQIQYRQPSVAVWSINPSTTNTYDNIGPLLPNTEYYVRVSSNCGANSCYSSTLLIKTKP